MTTDLGNLETLSRTTREPAQIVAGDSLQWTKSVADFPATDGYTLTYYLVSGSTTYQFDAGADGADYAISVLGTVTQNWTPGSYRWTACVRKGSDRFTVDAGRFRVLYNPAGTGALSHARKVLAAIEAVIESRATKDQEEFTVAGRSLKRTPLGELLKFRRKYLAEVAREEQAEDLARGTKTKNTIKVRMRGIS